MVNASCPYGFINSSNVSNLQIDGFPKNSSDAGLNETAKIEQFDREMAAFWSEMADHLVEMFEKRGAKPMGKDFENYKIRSDHFVIYMFPQELDYFDQEIKRKFNLWQIDSALHSTSIPKPYELPESFAALPGKIVYLSLGSQVSSNTALLQEIVDVLEQLPDYKYIVSGEFVDSNLKTI